ncbi:MAG: copper amine oxidase N-terminal domain-containing protein [Clostridiales bacterium]|nr:copper amine oxidase N-terminal domain-containing protein [Clostridiales bacterium]
MKKFIVLPAVLLLTVLTVYGGEISVVLDGNEVSFSGNEPVVSEGRTLIPVRGVFEQLGYEISWNGETKTAVFKSSDNEITITADSGFFVMNGEEKELDVPAQIIDGSMMLPLRAIGEAAGLEVEWDSADKTVSLTRGAAEADKTTETATETEAEETAAETAPDYEISDDEMAEIKTLAGDYADGLVLHLLYNSFKYNEADITRRSNEIIDGVEDKFGYTVSLGNFIYEPLDTEDSKAYQITGTGLGLYGNALGYETGGYAFYGAPTSDEYIRRQKLVGPYIMTEMLKLEQTAAGEIKNYEEILGTAAETEGEASGFISEFTDMTVKAQAFHNKRAQLYLQPNNEYYTKEKIDEFMGDSADCSEEYEEFDIEDFTEAVNKEMEKETYYNYVVTNLDDEEQAEVNSYRQEISSVYNTALSFFKNEDEYTKAEAYIKAEEAIRAKLDETPAPKRCLLDREILYKCCDYLKIMAEDIENGVEPEEIYSNKNTLEYMTYFSVFNLASKSALRSSFSEASVYGFLYEYFEPYRLYTAKAAEFDKDVVYKTDYITRQ